MSSKSSVLVTGASSGIGAVYAERFAARGHNLVLVARNEARMTTLAEKLHAETAVEVEILVADLTNQHDLEKVEQRLREDSNIDVLVNNAGSAIPGSILQNGAEDISNLIALNVTAPTRLAAAVASRFAAEGKGSIINIGSVVGLAPEIGSTVYGATKSYMLFLSQGISQELQPKGVYVQAVLPTATRTEIWRHTGVDAASIPNLMEVGALVDAAMTGFDRKEAVTIPPLTDEAQWGAYQAARMAMLPNFGNSEPAERYRTAA